MVHPADIFREMAMYKCGDVLPGWSYFVEVIFLVEHPYQVAAEAVLDTGADAFAVGIVYIRGEDKEKVNIIGRKHEGVAVERPSGEMAVYRHILPMEAFEAVITVVSMAFGEVVRMDIAPDEEVRSRVVPLCERVTVTHFADDFLFFRAAPVIRLVEYVYVQLDDVSGVGELLVDRLRANVRAVEGSVRHQA